MNTQQRFDAAVRRRDSAQRNLQQLQGRLAAAQEELRVLEKECLDRGVPSEKLEATIAQLEQRYDAAVAALESEVAAVEAQLAPFSEG